MSTRRAVLVALFVTACSSHAGPAPSVAGLGRVPDLPPHTCARTRAASSLRAGATATECHTDADCTQGRNGRCVELSDHAAYAPPLEGTTCSYDQCFVDADCGQHGECYCDARAASDPGRGHLCLSGECDTDADCGVGRYCRRGPAGKYCRSLRDQCSEETNCGEDRRCIKSATSGLYECVRQLPMRR